MTSSQRPRRAPPSGSCRLGERGLRAALLFALAVIPAAASAQARDPAGAESLFKKGLALLEKDDWAGACPTFEASMKLDPSVGAQINIARCSEHEGKIARAWAEYEKARVLNRETEGKLRKKDVDAFLEAAIGKLEPRLPWITLRVSPRPAGLELERDGVAIPVEGIDQAVPVDPGKHVFVARATGYREVRVEIEAKESSKQDVVISLERLPEGAAPPVGSVTATAPPKQPPPVQRPPPDDAGSGGTLVIAGALVGGVGAVSLAVAAITGGLAVSEHGKLEELCPGNPEGAETLRCPGTALDDAESARSSGESLALASTVTLFAGAAIAATGLTLVIVGATQAPKTSVEAAIVPIFAPGHAGLGLLGRF